MLLNEEDTEQRYINGLCKDSEGWSGDGDVLWMVAGPSLLPTTKVDPAFREL